MRFVQRASRGVLWPLLLMTFAAMAQRPTGELRVEVKDASGAPMQASGKIVNLSNGAIDTFDTDAVGLYSKADLPAGRYRVEVVASGFAVQNLVVEVRSGKPVTVSAKMAVGAMAMAVDVVAATPLAGVDRSIDEIPAPVQTASRLEIEASGALDLSDFLNRRLNGVHLNELQGNPLQPDLNYRGYTASPLLGTPQGVSVFMDGVRMNQPFGDVVNWDLIPRIVISEVALIPGSNPLFGLNTLGGSVSLRTKDGNSHPGTSLQLSGGSFGRKMAELEHGGAAKNGFHWFVASNLFFEDGWRDASPSNVRQFFGKFGWQRERTAIALTLAYANNSLIGNGLQEQRFLSRDYSSIYTKPDINRNRSPFANLSLRRSITNSVSFSGNVYFRYIGTKALNGDINEDSLDQSVYQPGAAERAALAAAGYTGVPASGATAANTPFPFWRCIGNVLLRDEPGEKCNGLLNTGSTQQRNYGISGQVSWSKAGVRQRNQLTVGAAYDGNTVNFHQLTELGYLTPDRGVVGTGAFADGLTGGDVDGEPFDTRVNLSGRIQTGSVYATDTVSLDNRWNLTFSGRFNRTSIDNRDRIRPAAGSGSLTGQHTYQRFNPAIGMTVRASARVNLYAGYTEGNRAPTSIELGCADPNLPCKLPNAMAGDPPLQQVTTRTIEAGVRSNAEGRLRWTAGWFRAANRNDILFVASQQTGFGYFKNFGQTLRQGVETNISYRAGRLTLGGGYTFLDATFRSAEVVNGAGNSTNASAAAGLPGVESFIQIQPGNRIPMVPQNMLKTYADLQVTSKFLVDVGVLALSSSYARGNENNRHQPDGRYYLGPGTAPGYAVMNIGAHYDVHRRAQLFVQVNNVLNRRFYSAAQLGPTGFTAEGNYIARPFPAIGTEFPVQQATFYAPGAPRGAWGGIRFRF